MYSALGTPEKFNEKINLLIKERNFIMIDINIQKFLNDMNDTPKKYLRVRIGSGRGVIALTDGSRMNLKSAVIAELQDRKPVFVYRYDADAAEDIPFNVVLGMRKNKAMAYIAGPSRIEHAGYIRCQSKHDLDDDDEILADTSSANKFLCGVFTTEHFTILIAGGSNCPHTMCRELVRSEEQPDIQDMIGLLGVCMAKQNKEVENVQEG